MKGHSWCYCYDNETLYGSSGTMGAQVHGNRTQGGTNADRHTFNAMASVVDESLESVTLALTRTGLWDKTLMVVAADNGGAINIAQGAGNNYPLRCVAPALGQ